MVTWEDRSVCLLLKTISYYRFVHRLFGFLVILDQGTNFFIFHTRGPTWQIYPPFMQFFLSFTLQGPLLALRPPQPQRAPAAQHRVLQADLLLPHHRLDLPRHRRRRHHHHQADRDRRLAG